MSETKSATPASLPAAPPSGTRGELGWIEWIRTRTQRSRASSVAGGAVVALGIGDDCAILRPMPGDELLVTTDFSLEGRHFRRDWHTARSAGHRTLARGLSDLAAMGARPVAAFLSLALPAADAREGRWVEGFLEGLLVLAERFEVPLAGGDTAESPSGQVLADIVLLGAAPAGTALRRSGARAGDLLYVTGGLGGAAADLRVQAAGAFAAEPELRPGELPGAVGGGHPQLYPEPRLGVGQQLRSAGLASACMDLSDGLSTDLAHLCAASGVGAVVDLERLPASDWLRSYDAQERESLLLHGGEDYELLFTAKAGTLMPGQIEGVPLTCIGRIVQRTPGRAPVWLRRGGEERPLDPGGWEHLRDERG